MSLWYTTKRDPTPGACYTPSPPPPLSYQPIICTAWSNNKITVFVVHTSGFKSKFHHFLVVYPWANNLTSLSLVSSLLNYENNFSTFLIALVRGLSGTVSKMLSPEPRVWHILAIIVTITPSSCHDQLTVFSRISRKPVIVATLIY